MVTTSSLCISLCSLKGLGTSLLKSMGDSSVVQFSTCNNHYVHKIFFRRHAVGLPMLRKVKLIIFKCHAVGLWCYYVVIALIFMDFGQENWEKRPCKLFAIDLHWVKNVWYCRKSPKLVKFLQDDKVHYTQTYMEAALLRLKNI